MQTQSLWVSELMFAHGGERKVARDVFGRPMCRYSKNQDNRKCWACDDKSSLFVHKSRFVKTCRCVYLEYENNTDWYYLI
jgi:hypothetical protein